MRTTVCFVLLCAMAGCTTARVRKEAALTLECGEPQVTLAKREEGLWMATGCGKTAICTLPDTDRAEVSCQGGGPSRETPAP